MDKTLIVQTNLSGSGRGSHDEDVLPGRVPRGLEVTEAVSVVIMAYSHSEGDVCDRLAAVIDTVEITNKQHILYRVNIAAV